jgi:histidine triad (HIT) family protein
MQKFVKVGPDSMTPRSSSKSDATCAFCAIAAGSVAAPVVFQDDLAMAFLDHRPIFPGHCLLIPRTHHETLADLPAELLAPFFAGAQLLARAVESAMAAEGTFVAINNRVSQSVPHLHIHIVPRRKGDGLKGFFWPRGKYQSDDEIRSVQRTIREAIAALRR